MTADAEPRMGIVLDTEMSPGEQATLVGVLAMVSPGVSLEIGTYTGGSLQRIAASSDHVHTFDLASHVDSHLPNVEYHLGDSAVTVPALLSDLEKCVAVDFVLVDGDHSRAGAYADACNVFDSAATKEAVILFHDIANEAVRAAVRDALKGRDFSFVDLSFAVSAQAPPLLGECWGGFGLVVRGGGSLWPNRPEIRANVEWPTTIKPGLTWHLFGPAREAKRWLLYRLRPVIRRYRGVRGSKSG